MDRSTFDSEFRRRLEVLSTTNLSDAMDSVGIFGAAIGIRPMFRTSRVVGRAITIRITAAGEKKSAAHLGIEAIAAADAGDVIVISNHGDVKNNCWGEVLSCASKVKGISGVIVDGAARDIDICEEMGFPVFARAAVPITARGRIMQEAYNVMIRMGDVQVSPGDIVVADVNGVVFIPCSKLAEVVSAAESLMQKEEEMKADLLAGMDVVEVDRKYNYENMLKK